MPHRVHFSKENVTLWVGSEANLRRACLDNDIDPYPLLGGLLSCHGKGMCGTCVVAVDPPEGLSPPGKREARWLKRNASEPGTRLSCQATVAGDCTIDTDPDPRPAWRSHGYYSGRPTRSWEQSS